MSENNEKNEEKKSEHSESENEKSSEIKLEDKLKDTEDKLLRSLAEIENQRRRFEKEIKDAFEFGSFNFAKESLAILDKFLENIEIIEKNLVSIFEKNNIKKIKTNKQKFDPNLHQAMSEIEDDKNETGTILEEIQSGYMLGDRLLRPSLVAVSKKKTPKKEEISEKKAKN